MKQLHRRLVISCKPDGTNYHADHIISETEADAFEFIRSNRPKMVPVISLSIDGLRYLADQMERLTLEQIRNEMDWLEKRGQS